MPVIARPGKRLPARLLLGALLLLAALAAAAARRAPRPAGADRPLRRARGPRARGLPRGAGRAGLDDLRAARPPGRLPRRAVEGTALPGRADARQAAGDRRRPASRAPRRAASRVRPGAAHASSARPAPPGRRPVATASVGGSVFTGLGFDTCSAPSTKAMAAWAESPFRGVGIYIGGENSACSQPNLSASWVSAQTTAGWHLIPTYVGLQATTSSCSSCAKMTTVAAATQGTAAAEDAVAEATAIGIGAGSPIYFDMESYTPTTSATKAVLTFLEAWTEQAARARLPVRRLLLAAAPGSPTSPPRSAPATRSPTTSGSPTGTTRKTRSTRCVPATAWANHQRIHQFRGGHDDTYGGVTINIDSDYVDGATVGVGTPPVGESDPIGSLELTGSPATGQVRVKGWALDPDAPTEALAINVVVGGREGQKGVETYELGQVANQSNAPTSPPRTSWPGRTTASTTSIVTIKSGPEPICVYAVNVALGGNRLLGCRTTTIPVAITLSGLRATRSRDRRQRHLRVPRRDRMPRPPRPPHHLQGGDAAPPQSAADPLGDPLARPAHLPPERRELAPLRAAAHRRRPQAAARTGQAADPAGRRDPGRPADRRPAARIARRRGASRARASRRAPRAAARSRL